LFVTGNGANVIARQPAIGTVKLLPAPIPMPGTIANGTCTISFLKFLKSLRQKTRLNSLIEIHYEITEEIFIFRFGEQPF
jgi:hypothetical protein